MSPAAQQLLVLLLGAAVLHGIYLSALIFFKNKNIEEGRLLGLALLSVSAYLLNYLLFLSGIIRYYPNCLGVLYPWVFLVGGSVYIFVKKSLLPGYRLKWRHLLHLLPFFWSWYRVQPLLVLPVEKKQAVIDWFLHPDSKYPIEALVEGNMHIFLLIGYAVATRQLSIRTEQAHMADENRRVARWMRRFSEFLLLLLFFDLSVKFLFYTFDIPASTVEYLLAAALALVIHLLGYHAIEHLVNFPKILPEQQANGKYKTSPLTPEQLETLRLALLDLMERERPYLQAELKINHLAAAINIPPHHLSQILNEGMRMGFYDFVNSYRVKAAREKLCDPQCAHYSILAVGLDCGFANKASFNRVFKKMTGLTPSEYAGRHRE